MTDAETRQLGLAQLHSSAVNGSAPSSSDPMIVLAYSCLRRDFDTLVSYRPSADDDVPSPEAIHKTRIATRRLRVALRMFKEMLPMRLARGLRDELGWFAKTLGGVRDLDVYMDTFRKYLETVAAEQHLELDDFVRYLESTRTRARVTLQALFDDPRYEAMLATFATFLANAPNAAALRRWRSFEVGDGARLYLEASVKRVLKRGNKITTESAAEKLHRLRIDAKRLRYELEFFADVYPSLESSAKIARRLQDVLGLYQDACTARTRVRDYIGDTTTPVELLKLMRAHEREAANARRLFAAEWRRFKKSISLAELRTLLAA